MSEASDVIEFDENYTVEDEDRLQGEEAGKTFAQRHILDKMNLFIKVYREKGWSMEFISGFVDGINEITGGSISLRGPNNPADEETEELLDNPPDSD